MAEPARSHSAGISRSAARAKWAAAGVLVLAIGFLVFWFLQVMAPRPAAEVPELAPLAEFAGIEPASETLALPAEGFVQARAQIALVSEVSGRIVEVAERLVSGARFEADELLVRIDEEPFQADLADAQAAVSRARVELENASRQLERIRALESRNFSARQRLEDAQVNQQRAQSALEQGQANVTRARIRLDDTRIRAPFDSEILSENAAIGRFVNAGEQIASLFATDFAEVRVGLARHQADLLATSHTPEKSGYFDLAGTGAEIVSSVARSPVTYAGVIDRVEPAVDPEARTINLVVRADQAFDSTSDRPPLLLGDLVEVRLKLTGRDDWWRIPATALKQPEKIWRLSPENTLEPLKVEVLFRADEQVVVQSRRLTAGDRLLLTDLEGPVAGMEVRPEGRTGESPSP
ncbi:MAG: efflux RND transporter periplasmic adaptor subunit [Oleiphilaceae bacterium]|nr:efflux RND transporter periplasmic adaptor subunit [Oleiphilaceae bacterium]